MIKDKNNKERWITNVTNAPTHQDADHIEVWKPIEMYVSVNLFGFGHFVYSRTMCAHRAIHILHRFIRNFIYVNVLTCMKLYAYKGESTQM